MACYMSHNATLFPQSLNINPSFCFNAIYNVLLRERKNDPSLKTRENLNNLWLPILKSPSCPWSLPLPSSFTTPVLDDASTSRSRLLLFTLRAEHPFLVHIAQRYLKPASLIFMFFPTPLSVSFILAFGTTGMQNVKGRTSQRLFKSAAPHAFPKTLSFTKRVP